MSLFAELKRRNVFRVGIAYGVTAWLLIQISDTVFPRIGLSESAVTLVIALLAIGFVPALIFAWAFEMTPEGIKRERDVDRAESITAQTGKKLDRVIIGVLAVAVVYLLVDKRMLPQPTAPAPAPTAEVTAQATTPGVQDAAANAHSIAVLPFVNMSADADNEYFSDGISEELLNVLVRVSALEVASRTSSFAYKGKDLPLSQIARELGVNHILEGSVRKSGNRVRITAQLIDAGNDRHLWSDTYERELDDIFDIQEEISNHIVDALKVALEMGEAADMARQQRPTGNTEAYELYLQGRFKWRQRLEDNVRASIDLFEQAIALDPNFAKAHEALASAWTVLPAWSSVPQQEAIEEALVHAEQALNIDPTLAEARATKAHSLALNHQWGESMSQFEAALEYEPRNAGVRQWYAENLLAVGYLPRALKQIEQAYQLDPASPVINNVYAHIASIAGEDELAVRHMRTALELGIPSAPFNAYNSLIRLGRWDTVEQLVLPLLESLNDEIGIACYEARKDPARKPELERLLRAPDAGPGAGRIAICSAVADRFDLAFEWMAVELARDPSSIGRYWDPDVHRTAMRKREEFEDMLGQLNLIEFYREHGWPDRCHPMGEDFACE